jgi:hypothetical protein
MAPGFAEIIEVRVFIAFFADKATILSYMQEASKAEKYRQTSLIGMNKGNE